MNFTELGLNPQILKAIQELGFQDPTEIQEKSIPLLLGSNKDYVGLAQTGTGKTAAFGLPLINDIDVSNHNTQALVLCPTRELCLQIMSELTKYAKYIPGLSIVPVYGGTDIVKQIRSLRKGAHIVVGTPGRLLDHIDRRTVDLSTVTTLVLDEADEMLNMGFKDDIDAILQKTTNRKCTWLFSATMPSHVESISKNYMKDPVKVTVGSKNSSAQNITHNYCVVRHTNRYPALRRLVDYYTDMFGIVFCRTRKEAKEIVDQLLADGYNADALHGDLSQAQRDNVMKKFRQKQLTLLIATDVAARGIDVSDVTHVIHYNLPDDVENYTHRSGRTARAGKHGISITLITNRDIKRIQYIERLINHKIEYLAIPTGKIICEKRLEHCIESITNTATGSEAIKPYMDIALEKLSHLTKEDLVQRLLSTTFDQFLNKYKHSADLNDTLMPQGDSGRYTPTRRPARRRGGNNANGGRSEFGSRSGGGYGQRSSFGDRERSSERPSSGGGNWNRSRQRSSN